jgi:hypothetical protein
MSIILILLLTLSGFCLTRFLFDTERTFVRLAVGAVVGSAVFGTLSFVVFCLVGMTTASVWAVLIVSCLPLILLIKHKLRRELVPWFDSIDYLFVAYYAVFFIIIYTFFDRAMLVSDKGIFTGGSQNLGDLPYHLGAIFSFTEGNNFPPENPSFSGAKFTYPFIADLIGAAFVKIGISVREAIIAANVAWAFALVVLLEELQETKLRGRLLRCFYFFAADSDLFG